jgi:glycosyltransferase A (GT-A) superfamily protein (DUF2064 family)
VSAEAGSSAGPAAVVVGRAPHDELGIVLLRRALAWARAAAPGADYTAVELTAADEARLELPPPERRLTPHGDPHGAGAMEVAERLFAAGHTPVLLAGTECPVLSLDHATAARDDLDNECDLVIGPMFGGGWYLLGLARPIPELASLPADSWDSPDVMALAVVAAQQAGLEIGLLRPERRLLTPADHGAALVDPLVPLEVRAAL